jgi:myosin-1
VCCRYALLNREVHLRTARGDDKKLCDTLVRGLGWTDGKEYAMGKTKIFIQEAATLFLLEDMVDRKINDAVVVGQKAWRKYKQKRYYLEMKAAGYDVGTLIHSYHIGHCL